MAGKLIISHSFLMKKREHSEILQTSELVTIEFDESGVHIDPQQTTVMRQKKKKEEKGENLPWRERCSSRGEAVSISSSPICSISPANSVNRASAKNEAFILCTCTDFQRRARPAC